MHRAVNHVLEALKPYTKENGGQLKVQHIAYVEGRGNLIVKYKKVSKLYSYHNMWMHGSVHIAIYVDHHHMMILLAI